ncbi:MAG: Ig-like domain-containing protein [Syntrophomonas sp.]
MIRAIRGKKTLILAILAVLCCMFIALPVLAEGDGSGGGKDVPLSLASSNPANGQNNVPVTTDINLTFNKNVVNLAIKDNNMKCFSLSANGTNVPIQVNMPDDQVDFEHRRNIDVNPSQELKPGTVYKLVISGQLMAKNGMSLGTPVTVSFTTAGAVANQNTNTGQDTQSPKNSDSVKSGSTESEQQTSATEEVKTEKTTKDGAKVASKDTKEKGAVKSEAKSKNEDKETETAGRGIAVAAGLVLIAAGGYGYYRYSHKK